jgi:hypothetical protein
MNLAVRGIDADIKWNTEGTFHKNELPDLRADVILANPPFNISDWGGERLREDFEMAQMAVEVSANWEQFLITLRSSCAPVPRVGPTATQNAHKRVIAALQDLGPGLSDVTLRCCCFLEGLETAEKTLGWSARSGKIVLRIALMGLKRHYTEKADPSGAFIG